MAQNTIIQSLGAIDKASYVPIYVQLKDMLALRIRKNKLKPGERIPSENELADGFQISRMTVRQAIKELEREGYISIRRGEGTFVRKTPQTQMLIKLDGFSTEMQKLGLRVHSEVLEARKIESSRENQNAFTGLNEDPANPIVVIRRTRYLENKPFAVEASYMKLAIGEALLGRGFDGGFSIYKFIERDLKIHLAKAQHVIRPSLAGKEIAKLLMVKEGSPILSINGTTLSSQGEAVEYLEGQYKGDEYRLHVEIGK